MINKSIIFVVLFGFGGFAQTFASVQSPLEPLPKYRFSTVLITQLVNQYHYKPGRLDDALSAEIFDEYLKTLDPNRNIFTKSDINQFSRFKLKLDDALSKGDLEPAFTIFRQFSERSIERANYALKRLETKFDFSINESYLFDREKSAWPEDVKALDEIWRKRVKNDYLSLLLAGKQESELKETLRKRYQRLKKRATQFKPEDVYEFFINAYLRRIEPHTAYFSPRTSENFNINMRLSLEGIGAVLQIVDDYTVVRRIVKGGAADLSHSLHAGDKIIGVGQGEEKVEDVVGWRLDDVVDKIRGPKDTVVQLHILPEDNGPGGSDKYISIVRKKIKLEDQQVKKSIIEIPDAGVTRKIGVVEIPAFYMDFAAAARGEKDFRSTTRDTHKLIDELKAENVDGIVVDLRGNGGGSLIEAVSLTGLFIKKGPVVQIRRGNGELKVDADKDPSIAYNGPLTVLVDRYSASASEIFAGAIQDYGRGTIVGEPTYGKGTVQTIIDLNNYVKGKKRGLGQIKITMAQFFRVKGDSTQFRGVVPDIVFPTAIESNDQGERSLVNALPWAKIPFANFSPVDQVPSNYGDIIKRHKTRVKTDSGFNFFLAQAKRRQEILSKNELLLLESKRKTEREQRKEERNKLLNQFRLSRGLPEVSLTDSIDATQEDIGKEPDSEAKKLSDELRLVLLREAAAIVVDLNGASVKDKI